MYFCTDFFFVFCAFNSETDLSHTHILRLFLIRCQLILVRVHLVHNFIDRHKYIKRSIYARTYAIPNNVFYCRKIAIFARNAARNSGLAKIDGQGTHSYLIYINNSSVRSDIFSLYAFKIQVF